MIARLKSVNKKMICLRTRLLPKILRHSSHGGKFIHQDGKQTHFGFETIPESEKTGRVHEVFQNVASSYDLMNDAMSLGIHRFWKDVFMERLNPVPGTHLIDMAGGTGDIAFRFMKYLKNQDHGKEEGNQPGPSSVTVCDINEHMLNVGQERAERLNLQSDERCKIDWMCANAENLQFENDKFSAYTIAFGIRNVTNIDKALLEAHRVLRPGGRFLCLEFSHLENKSMQWIYDQYSFKAIPILGQILAGQWDPYQYLVESIRKFPKQDEFKYMIEQAGFKHVTYENLNFGVVAIHSGFKL